MTKQLLLAALSAVTLVSATGAVTINNHSFELSSKTHYDGGPGEWSSAMGGIKTAMTAEEFGSAAPDGSGVIFAYLASQKTSQVLAAKLTPSTTYTLQMDMLRRGDKEGPVRSMLALGYGAAGPEGGTQLARIVSGAAGAPVPREPGEIVTWTLTFKTGDSHPGLGEPLWIQLGGEGAMNQGSCGYDNIRLVADQKLPDADGDGLPDEFELRYTDPASKTSLKTTMPRPTC